MLVSPKSSRLFIGSATTNKLESDWVGKLVGHPRSDLRDGIFNSSEREALIGGASPITASAVEDKQANSPAWEGIEKERNRMSSITTKDGTQIYYKDWGHGQPIVFSHGWPLTADEWDPQMLFFGQHSYRVIAHDRRGHGRSGQTWDGNDMNTYSDDLAALFEALDLRNAIMVGHSTGGGEVARYLGRYGTKRVTKAVLIGAVAPLMLQTEKNPGGLPIAVFDSIRTGVASDRSQFYKDITLPFYGYNRPGAKVSEGIRERWWLQGMSGGIKAHYDCVQAFSETDFTEDLNRIDIPVLVMHGDDDQIVPIGASGLISAKILKKATLKVYPGFPHGMTTTHSDHINADILTFLRT
jgi:non-heme chloroperoxidase